MNQKWKIILSTCLAIAICFTMASAAFDSSFTKSSYDKSSAAAFADAKVSAMENMKTSFDKPAFNLPDPIVKPEFPDVPEKPTVPEFIRPAFNPLPAPTFRVPEWGKWSNPSSSGGTSEITITRDEAIEIALEEFPGGDFGSIKATLKRINAPAYPLAVNPCWVVQLEGVHSDCSAKWNVPGYGIDITIPLVICRPYGGEVIIDAISGEVLYKSVLL